MAGALVAFPRRMTREAFLQSLRIASPVLVVIDKPPLLPVTEQQVANWPKPPASLTQDMDEATMPRAQRPPSSAARMVRTFRWRKHKHDPRPIEATTTGSGLTAFVPGDGSGVTPSKRRVVKGPMGLDASYVALCQLPSRLADGKAITAESAARLRGCTFLHVPGPQLPPSWLKTSLKYAIGTCTPPAKSDAKPASTASVFSRHSNAPKSADQGLVWLMDVPNGDYHPLSSSALKPWDWSGRKTALSIPVPDDANNIDYTHLASRPRAGDAVEWLNGERAPVSFTRERLRLLRLVWPLKASTKSQHKPPTQSQSMTIQRARSGRRRSRAMMVQSDPEWAVESTQSPIKQQQLQSHDMAGDNHMWDARDTDVASTMPPDHWLLTVASTSGCGKFAVVNARRSQRTPFSSTELGATPCLSSLGLRVLDVQRPSQNASHSLHPALEAVVAGHSADVLHDQCRAAKESFDCDTMRMDPIRSLEDVNTPEDCYAVLEAASVDWSTGHVTPPLPPQQATKLPSTTTTVWGSPGADSSSSYETTDRSGEPRVATAEQLVRDGTIFAREAMHCCSLIAFPKLQRTVLPEATAQSGVGKPPRVQIQWSGLESRLSALPEDMVMRSTHRFDVGHNDLARLVQCVAGADRAVAAVHKQLCDRRIVFLQLRLDSKRLLLAREEAESNSARV